MHLAQLNVGRLLADPGDARVSEFMGALDQVNGLGKRMPGFVWMMEGSGEPGTGNTSNFIDGDPRFVANLTVWESPETLRGFVWNTIHALFFKRRSEWFLPMEQPNLVFWWIKEGYRPTLAEGLERLEHLRTNGATEHAFGWDELKSDASAQN